MRKVIFSTALLVLIFSCGRKIPTTVERNTPSLFSIETLKTDNISEEITGNDEIHLLTWLIKDSLSTAFLLQTGEDSLTFSAAEIGLAKKLTIQHGIDTASFSKMRVVIVLIEADTEEPFEKRTALVREVLQEANYQDNNAVWLKMSESILDDDLLGFSSYKLSDLQNVNGQIVFSGIHLFDRYSYRLKFQLK